MSGGAYINKLHPSTIVDPVNPEQPGAAVVSAEPGGGVSGVVVYTSVGYADNPIRVDPTGTTIQPVNVVSGGGINSSVAPTGAAVPSNATYIGAKDGGGNLAGLLVDGSGKLEVNATITATSVELSDGVNGPVSVFALLDSKSLAVAIVDASGNQISSFGGGTQYASGATQATPTGTVALGKDSSNVLHAVATDVSGLLNVNVVSGGGSPDTNVAKFGGTAVSIGQQLMAASIPVVLASNHADVNVHVQNFPATTAVTQSTSPWVTSFSAPQHVVVDSASLGTVSVSGTVTANAGSGTFSSQDAADQTIGVLVGTEAQMVGASDSLGKVAFLNLDAGGNLKVVASGTTSTQYVDGAVTPTPTGTAALGFDGTDVWALRLDASKNLNVNLAANSFGTLTTSVSGTVTVTGTVALASEGVPGSVSQPAKAIQVAGWDGAHLRVMATDASGNVGVNLQNIPHVVVDSGTVGISGSVGVTQSTSPWVTKDASDGAPATASQPSQAIQVAGWDGSNLRVLSTDASGKLNITGSISATNPSVGATGVAIPADATLLGASDGVNLQPLLVESASQLNLRTSIYRGAVEMALDGSGFPTVNVNGTVPVSGTVTANAGTGTFGVADANLELAQGSTTSGQVGPLVMGAVTASAPTYTTAKTNPLSLDTSGNLRVAVSNAVTVSGTVGVSGTVAVTQSTSPWVISFTAPQHAIVDSGAVTVSGSVTANIGTTGGLALDATLTGGTMVAKVVPNAPVTMLTTLASVSFAASGDNIIVAGVGGKTIRIMRLVLVASGATNLTFKDSTPTSFSGAIPMSNYGSFLLGDEGEPWFLAATGKDFVINSSNAVQISGMVYFSQT